MPNALGEHLLQLAGAQLRVVQAQRPGEHDVRRQRRLLAARRPQVQMMHRLDARLGARARRARRATSRLGGHRFEQHAASRRAAAATPPTTTSTAITIDAIGSSQSAPNSATPTPATITASEPSASASEVPERAADVEVAVRVRGSDGRARRR